MVACEECSRLCDKSLPPQSGCNDCYDLLRDNYKKLQAENAKLRECVKFYAQPWERGELDGELLVRKSESYDLFTEVHYKAKQCLKELGDK